MNTQTLDKLKKGNKAIITHLPAGVTKSQLIRLGITEGISITCMERLPGGTIVLQKNRQEIALGYDLAKKIKIEKVKI